MRIELWAKDGHKSGGKNNRLYLSLLFHDSSADLDRAWAENTWVSGAIQEARVLFESGWKVMKRSELEALLTKGEHPERALKREELLEGERSGLGGTQRAEDELRESMRLEIEELKRMRAELQLALDATKAPKPADKPEGEEEASA